MASTRRLPNGRWQARYRDETGKEHARHFDRKIDSTNWLADQTASMLRGDYVDPRRGTSRSASGSTSGRPDRCGLRGQRWRLGRQRTPLPSSACP